MPVQIDFPLSSVVLNMSFIMFVCLHMFFSSIFLGSPNVFSDACCSPCEYSQTCVKRP